MIKAKKTSRKLLVPEEADHVVIFTDGACLGNPGPGGYGAILRFKGNERRVSGGEEETTNNRMELMAVIKALGSLKRDHPVIVFSDSQYVAKGISEWLPNWKARGWRTADKKPVKNADLWKRLDEVAAKYEVEWEWVRGHAGHPGNEKAHRLASREAEKAAL